MTERTGDDMHRDITMCSFKCIIQRHFKHRSMQTT